jgi:hypothetical protein
VMASHRDRIRSIRTPERRDRITPSKRTVQEDAGPTPFALMRKAEMIGKGVVCDITTRRVTIGTGKADQAKAEFASSSALARLLHEDLIDGDQYRGGTHYARLHRLVWGRATARESSLTKVMASSMEEMFAKEIAARRDELDDAEYTDWLAEQRVLLERGEYALTRIPAPILNKAKHAAAKANTYRRQVRVVLRQVCIEDIYPRRTLVTGLRAGLNVLAETWELDR